MHGCVRIQHHSTSFELPFQASWNDCLIWHRVKRVFKTYPTNNMNKPTKIKETPDENERDNTEQMLRASVFLCISDIMGC